MLGSYVFGFVTQGLYFVVIARTLGASEFGLFAGAMALVAVLASLVGLGSGNVLVLRSAREPGVINAQLGTSLIYILVSAIPFAAVALALGLVSGPNFFAVLIPLVFSEIFTLRLFDLAQQVFQATERLGRTAICGILAGSLRVGSALVFTLIPDPSARGWSYWYAATTAATAFIVIVWAISSIGRPAYSLASLRSTWRLGFFFSLGTASRTLYMDADKYILSSYGLLAASGGFSAASKIVTMAFAPIQALVYSLNTRLFRAGQAGPRASWAVIRRPLFLVIAYGVFCSIALGIASPLVPILLGSSYTEASHYLFLLAPLVMFNGLHYLFGDALMGLGRQALRSLIQFGAACAAVATNVLLIPVIGASAAILSALACSVTLAGVMSLIFMHTYRTSPATSESLILDSKEDGINTRV